MLENTRYFTFELDKNYTYYNLVNLPNWKYLRYSNQHTSINYNNYYNVCYPLTILTVNRHSIKHFYLKFLIVCINFKPDRECTCILNSKPDRECILNSKPDRECILNSKPDRECILNSKPDRELNFKFVWSVDWYILVGWCALSRRKPLQIAPVTMMVIIFSFSRWRRRQPWFGGKKCCAPTDKWASFAVSRFHRLQEAQAKRYNGESLLRRETNIINFIKVCCKSQN